MSDETYPRKINKSEVLTLLTGAPTLSLCLRISGCILYVDRNEFMASFKDYYLYTASPYERSIYQSFLESAGKTVIEIDLKAQPQQTGQKASFINMFLGMAKSSPALAVYDETKGVFLAEILMKTTGLMEDYRTGEGTIEYLLPSGVSIAKLNWAS